eukprot:4311101-Karenia_brevis.AAC.1
MSADGIKLVTPGSMSKQRILEVFLECCQNPIYKDAKSIKLQPPIPISKTGVWRELHAADMQGVANPHDHLPVQGVRQFMHAPVKRALLY